METQIFYQSTGTQVVLKAEKTWVSCSCWDGSELQVAYCWIQYFSVQALPRMGPHVYSTH